MLKLAPISLRAANEYVAEHHRHNQPTRGHKFSIAVEDDGRLCGVVICGQPVARMLCDGKTLEIRRVCTDGTKNACSILYGAASRAAHAMGYTRVITYTLESESGSSLRASGFVCSGAAGGKTWDTPARRRQSTVETAAGTIQKYPSEKKLRWEKHFNE